MIYFISDLHFGHRNCLAYDNRPGMTVEEHDEILIERWNSVVGIDDTVWILGDISWYGPQKTIEIFNRLNGTKNLCVGNHDKKLMKNKDVRALFAEIHEYGAEVQLTDKIGIVLSHWPITCFNHHYYGWYHFYGHVHKSYEWEMMKRNKREMEELYEVPCHMYNVGCMTPCMNYYPRTMEEIINFYTEEEKREKEGN